MQYAKPVTLNVEECDRLSFLPYLFGNDFLYSGTMKVTPDRITDYKAPSAEEAAVASQAAKRPPVVNYPGEGFREMTKAQWAALPRDCKAVRSVEEAEDHGAYRYRRTMDNNFRLVNVYITDMKITEIPQK